MTSIGDRTLRQIGNQLLDAYGTWRAQRYDVSDTIVVACTGRGGSTWLAQIISSLPRHHILWEQLHWRTNPACQTYGFGRPVYLTEENASEEQASYLHKVLTGGTLPSAINTSQYFEPWSLLRLRSYVAKLVTANMLLPWLVERFGVRAVLMVRHPCAVVASQIRHGRWDELDKSFCKHTALFDEYPHLARIFDSVHTKVELLAFNWAVQNFVPLTHPTQDRWITTTYETLVVDRMDEVHRIFRGLGEEVPSKAESMLDQSSATALNSQTDHRSQKQLSKWKRQLSSKEMDQILRVAHDTGICAYGEGIYPQQDRMIATF